MYMPVLAERQRLIYIGSVHTGCNLEDLPGAMDDMDGCCERVRKLCSVSTT